MQQGNYWDFCKDTEGKFFIESGKNHLLSAVSTIHDYESPQTVIICHGLFSSKENRLCQTIAKHLSINAVRFDFHGNGESQGADSWSFGDYHGEVNDDLRKVVEFLRNKGLEIKAIIGHSRGGVETLMYSWMYDDVDIIISISARFDLANSIITRFISDEQYEKLKNNVLESVEIIPRDNIPRKITLECINKRNLVDYNMLKTVKNTKYFLLIHGTKDDIVPVQDSSEIAKFIPPQIPHEIVLIEDGSHSLTENSEIRSLVNHHINRVISSLLNKKA
ncbi:Alpha/beta hydrolase family protein [Cryptosporidium meleagridis]|uniref:Alpha/beta hydrolase family protein n=1 Tax=Cryptosporidium meleagridis TaxID=93969 RepID=A0A2P4YW23_9CRYT|nr:Alpha/beta hydrolase family protein [Cryptosporidium meleagridis]